jgi:DeoR family transcriptional regulator, suf operon transcriptional repressor
MARSLTLEETSPRTTILRVLQSRGSASIKDLEVALGVTATAVREQVAHLIAEDIIMARRVRGDVGRPFYVYSLTAKAQELFPKDYGELAHLLLQEILDVDGPDKLQQLLDRVGDRLAAQYAGQLRGQELEDKLRALADLLVQKGIGAAVRPATVGDGFVLHANTCPYFAVVQDHREICGMEQQMLSRLLGADVVLGDCVLDGHAGCQFHVQRALGDEQPVISDQ